MTCIITPDGPCTITPSGDCIAPKEPGVLDVLTGIFIQGFADKFVITWDTTSHPTERVSLFYRDTDSIDFHTVVTTTRDSGTISSETGLTQGCTYLVWLRAENDTEYGDWVVTLAITDAAWDSDSEVVEHNGEVVFHGTDVVLIS